MSASNWIDYDIKNVLHPNKLVGLWRLMTGFHGPYLIATLSLGIAALAKTSTYLLLRYFVDHYFTGGNPPYPAYIIALGFVGLAVVEGAFTFTGGRLAAFTAEGVTRRLRNYLFDHIQHLSYTYHSKTQNGRADPTLHIRCGCDPRFFADQAIAFGRIIFLLLVNFIALLNLNVCLALVSIVIIPIVFWLYRSISSKKSPRPMKPTRNRKAC